MSRYVLSPAAQEDLLAIRDYYLEEAGYRAARTMLVEFVGAFRRIARNPGIGHKREDLAGARPVFFWPARDYLIVYRTVSQTVLRAKSSRVEIVMIARGSRDLAAVIRRRSI